MERGPSSRGELQKGWSPCSEILGKSGSLFGVDGDSMGTYEAWGVSKSCVAVSLL